MTKIFRKDFEYENYTCSVTFFVCEPKSFSKIFREGAFTKIFEKDFGDSLRLFIHVHIRVDLHKIQRS